MDPDYEVFVSVIEQGSLAGAARKLKISAPMVSKRLARLEEKLGIQLVHRTTRRLAPTSIGQLFYDDISAVVAAAREAEARVSSNSGALTGELRIGTVNSLGRLYLAQYLAPFLDTHPGLNVYIDVSDQPVDLVANKVDVEVTFSPPSRTDTSVRVLAPDRRILCASPEYVERRGMPHSIEELHRHDIVAAPITMPWRLTGPEGAFELHLKSRIHTNSSELPGAFSLAGYGIALRPVWAIREDLKTGHLLHILPEYACMSDMPICAVYPRNRMVSPNVIALVEYLVSAFSEFDSASLS